MRFLGRFLKMVFVRFLGRVVAEVFGGGVLESGFW